MTSKTVAPSNDWPSERE